eukprot:RCo024242
MTSLSTTGYSLVPDYSFEFSPNCFSDVSELRPPLIFGMVISLSGPDNFTGQRYQAGLMAAIAERNAQGGIGGHMLSLLVRDDQSNSSTAGALGEELMTIEDVFAVFGTTKTSEALSLFNDSVSNGVPFIGPMSGSMALRSPFVRSVIHLRASCEDEVMALVTFFVQTRGWSGVGYLSLSEDPGE